MIDAKTSGRLSRKIPCPLVASQVKVRLVASQVKARRPVRAPMLVTIQVRPRTARQPDQSDEALKPAWCPWPAKSEINQPDRNRLPIFSGENEEPGAVRTSIARRPGR